MMEAILLLATIAQKVQVQIASGQKVKTQQSVTLRPKNGIQVKLRMR